VKSVRWGLIGAGWIATRALAPAIHASTHATIQAVASRDLDRARALNPVSVYDSYEALLNDPLVDAVYISLPNHLHCEWTIKALQAGKHVLCEKPFAMNLAEVELMVAAAHDNNRLLMEAVWSRWHPQMVRLIECVNAGDIGQIKSIESSFTFPASIYGNYRLSPEMGGGALFDIGVYPLHAFAGLIGDTAQSVIESCEVNMGLTGIDLSTKWRLRFDNSIFADGLASFEQPENQTLSVVGQGGSIQLLGDQAFTSWHAPSTLKFDDRVEEFEACDPYMLMVENFGKKIQGEESWVLPLETSLWVAKIVDQLRAF